MFSENLIENVEISNSVSEISSYAFYKNPMTEVTFGPDVNSEIFENEYYNRSAALLFLTSSNYKMTVNLPKNSYPTQITIAC